MIHNRVLIPILAMLAAGLAAGAQAQQDYSSAGLTALQTNAIRAQLVPLRKGVFSAGLSAIIEKIAVQEGDFVEAGDLLLAFDCDGIEASRKASQARLDSARATLEVNRELLKLNSVGPLQVRLNEAEVEVAVGELDLARSRLKHCELRAPFAGAVTARIVEEYQFVAEGEAMLELVSRNDLELRMLLPSTALAWLRQGSTFTMVVEELNQSMAGRVTRIGGAVDPVSLTVPVFGVLTESSDDLLPGMSGRVSFTGAETD